jgi:hypothetical protein
MTEFYTEMYFLSIYLKQHNKWQKYATCLDKLKYTKTKMSATISTSLVGITTRQKVKILLQN